jgi:hypothetical protein
MTDQGHDEPQPTGVADIDREHALELRVVREVHAPSRGIATRRCCSRASDVTNASPSSC